MYVLAASAKPADFQWNFANSNMLQYYTDAVMANKVKFTMRSGGSESDTAEVVFHSMFGTYMDDLGVLSAITNWGAWKQRKQLSAVFTKRHHLKLLLPPNSLQWYPKWHKRC